MPASMPRYHWKLLRAGPLWLDGGGMFGIIPRVVWSRTVKSDDLGRIELAHNCLLLWPDSGSPTPGGGNTPLIVIETGSGNKFDQKSRKIYSLTDRSIIDAIEETGRHCSDVTDVFVTHLHFDHAGGLTRLGEAGETPRLTFPNAAIHVQRREWVDALANRSTMTRTYLRDHLDPIRQQVRLIDSPTPFVAGHLPQRDELPPTPVASRMTDILPGIKVFIVPGHTWGQQAVLFTDVAGRTVVFSPDVMPTVHHVGSAYNLAYDVEPYISTVTRRWFLDEAARNHWLLVLDHEPGNPLQQVRPDSRGWYELLPAPEGSQQPHSA